MKRGVFLTQVSMPETIVILSFSRWLPPVLAKRPYQKVLNMYCKSLSGSSGLRISTS